MLGQFVSQTLSRWWDIRTRGIGNLWGAINDLSMWASAWWPKEGGSQQAARALVLRYGLLAMDLLFRQGRGEDGPAYMAELVAKGLLEPHEAAVLAPHPLNRKLSFPGSLSFGRASSETTASPVASTARSRPGPTPRASSLLWARAQRPAAPLSSHWRPLTLSCALRLCPFTRTSPCS